MVPRQDGRLQPLCALYRRDPVLAAAREKLATGDVALRAVLDAVETVTLDDADLAQVDPQRTALTNVNTPEELARALSLGRS